MKLTDLFIAASRVLNGAHLRHKPWQIETLISQYILISTT